MTDNGKIPDHDLSTVAVGVQLTVPTANAYRALVAQAAHEHVSVRPAPGEGSGYRSLAVQEDFWKADHGDKAAQARTRHVPGDVPVAAPGGSSHGWGNRIDLLFNGSSAPTAVALNLAKRYGFVREFGSADANHFEHDGKTAIQAPVHTAPAEAAHPNAPGAQYVTVKSGDTLSEIAEDHRLTLQYLEGLNPQISHPDVIHPGDRVRVK